MCADTAKIENMLKEKDVDFVKISAQKRDNLPIFFEKIIKISPKDFDEITITGNLVNEG
ncbi:MAG: hypothetical protein L6V93_06790 [Clostridiales bacterium]|nr:MAG: hypothetical protein L6V93_06790 [Clostridiales bacterium]